jgi:hypothetical protein
LVAAPAAETIMEQAQAAPPLCPHCRVELVMSQRRHVEIDYCPKCGGVWLDFSELIKIERAVAEAKASGADVLAAGWGKDSRSVARAT